MQLNTAVNKIIKMRRELGNETKAKNCKAACLQNGWIPVSMRYALTGKLFPATDSVTRA